MNKKIYELVSIVSGKTQVLGFFFDSEEANGIALKLNKLFGSDPSYKPLFRVKEFSLLEGEKILSFLETLESSTFVEQDIKSLFKILKAL